MDRASRYAVARENNVARNFNRDTGPRVPHSQVRGAQSGSRTQQMWLYRPPSSTRVQCRFVLIEKVSYREIARHQANYHYEEAI
jgi:hypothetical protein